MRRKQNKPSREADAPELDEVQVEGSDETLEQAFEELRDLNSGLEELEEPEADAISEEIREEAIELAELRDRHLRLAAEFENYRKRTRREMLESADRAEGNLTGRLLEVLDDLGRFADLEPEQTTVEALHEGVELVERKLLKVLRDSGLEVIDAEGQKFDPNIHDALLSIPTASVEEDDIVAQVILTGYRFGDRLLRPAQVVVKNRRPTSTTRRTGRTYHGDAGQRLLQDPRCGGERLAGRDKEGLPQARQEVPSGRESRQSGGDGTVQGDFRGAPRSVGCQTTQAVRSGPAVRRTRRTRDGRAWRHAGGSRRR
jgi:molecular chaperone GrpE